MFRAWKNNVLVGKPQTSGERAYADREKEIQVTGKVGDVKTPHWAKLPGEHWTLVDGKPASMSEKHKELQDMFAIEENQEVLGWVDKAKRRYCRADCLVEIDGQVGVLEIQLSKLSDKHYRTRHNCWSRVGAGLSFLWIVDFTSEYGQARRLSKALPWRADLAQHYVLSKNMVYKVSVSPADPCLFWTVSETPLADFAAKCRVPEVAALSGVPDLLGRCQRNTETWLKASDWRTSTRAFRVPVEPTHQGFVARLTELLVKREKQAAWHRDEALKLQRKQSELDAQKRLNYAQLVEFEEQKRQVIALEQQIVLDSRHLPNNLLQQVPLTDSRMLVSCQEALEISKQETQQAKTELLAAQSDLGDTLRQLDRLSRAFVSIQEASLSTKTCLASAESEVKLLKDKLKQSKQFRSASVFVESEACSATRLLELEQEIARYQNLDIEQLKRDSKELLLLKRSFNMP